MAGDAPWKATQHITLQPVYTDPLEIEIRTGRMGPPAASPTSTRSTASPSTRRMRRYFS